MRYLQYYMLIGIPIIQRLNIQIHNTRFGGEIQPEHIFVFKVSAEEPIAEYLDDPG